MSSVTFARIGLAAALLSIAAPRAVPAQGYLPVGDAVHERIFEVSPLAGWFMPDDNAGYDSGSPMLGIRGSLNNSSLWGFEAQVALAPGQSQFVPEGTVDAYAAQPVYNAAGFPIGVVITQLETTERISEYDSSLLMFSGSVLVHLSKNRLRPFVTVGGGFIDDIGNDGNPPSSLSNMFLEAGGGLKYYRPSGWGVRVDLKDVFMRKSDVPRDLVDAPLLAATFDALSGGGADGVPFREPYRSVEFRGRRWLHNVGISVALTVPFGFAWKDGDGDNIETRFDECPTTAPNVVVNAVGCGIDTDEDGVFDGIDTCAGTAKGATVDNNGCPADQDGDGVLDGIDVANDTPPGALVDATGQHRDSDQDGVLDGLDQCEGTPIGAAIDATGCAADAREDALLRGQPIVVSGVVFDPGTAELDPRAYRPVNGVARVIERWTSHPENPLRVEIGVHAAEGETQKLAQERADVLRTYLLENFFGMGANNLSARGYAHDGDGATRPVEVRSLGVGEAPMTYEQPAEGTTAP
jgi:outer membrane protein OmpA-like peptidoglycan-associated protein